MRMNRLTLATNSPCQNKCAGCGTEEYRKRDPGYQMQVEEVERFAYYTKKSGYRFDHIVLSGFGEPTLWKHINEALPILNRAGIAGGIKVVSNARSLRLVKHETWEHVSLLRISEYPNIKDDPTWYQDAVSLRDRGLVNVEFKECHNFHVPLQEGVQVTKPDFNFVTQAGNPLGANLPCRCICPGPMLYKDYFFPYCSKSIFVVGYVMNKDWKEFKGLYTKVDKANYLDEFPNRIFEKEATGHPATRNFEECRYCPANSNLKSSEIKLGGIDNKEAIILNERIVPPWAE